MRDLADGGGVDPGEAAGVELAGSMPSPKLDLDLAAVEEVELLLLVVVVAAGLVGGRQDDRVDAEGGHAELLADLAEARALAEVGEVGDGVAVALVAVGSVVSSLIAAAAYVNNLSPPDDRSRPPPQIPAELKPADGRFGCGPSKVRPEALAALAERVGR